MVWQDAPTKRGTLQILYLCLTTLALCVWTAVHPNVVPAPGSSLYERLGMMVLAVVFPEIILSSAWAQLRKAQKLALTVNAFHSRKSRSDPPETLSISTQPNQRLAGTALLRPFDFQPTPEEPEPQDTIQATAPRVGRTVSETTEPVIRNEAYYEPWKLQHAYFAVMGGYAVEGIKLHPKTLKVTTTQRLLTAGGVSELALADLLPEIGKEDIEEWSDADKIAKFVVIFQVYWFLFQVVERLIEDKAVTLLEAHTAVHVVCTIFLYTIWMRKPYNIKKPVMLKGADVNDMVSLFTFDEVNRQIYLHKRALFESDRERYWKRRLVDTANHQAADGIIDHDPPPNPPIFIKTTALIRDYSSSEKLASDKREEVLKSLAPSASRALTRLHIHYAEVSDIDRETWDCLRDSSENFALIRDVWGGWSTNSGHELSLDKGFHLVFNLLYGAGHLAAWAAIFPTSGEQWIWRASGIMLASIPIWGLLWILWWKAVNSTLKILAPFRNGDVDIIAAPFFFIIGSVYVLSRCYFLVESLASLRDLPPTAYDTVRWMKNIPPGW